jgi:hypothetical protein
MDQFQETRKHRFKQGIDGWLYCEERQSLKVYLVDKLPERSDFGTDVNMEVVLDQRIGIY